MTSFRWISITALLLVSTAWAADQPVWHLVVENQDRRQAVRVTDGAIVELKVGVGQRAVAVGAGESRTVRHAASPDGRQFAYQMTNTDRPIDHVISVAGADGKDFKVIADRGDNTRPAWSPDGRHIAFLGRRGDSWHVYRIDADGTNEKQISREPVSHGCGPTFAHDGRLIYAVNRGRDGKLPLMDLVIDDGEKATVLIAKNYVIEAAANPQGTVLAAVVPFELSIRDLKTEAVTKHDVKSIQPNWAVTYYGLMWRKDGRAVAFPFGFLGGRMAGTLIEGENHVGVLDLDDEKPKVRTFEVGHGRKLYAWVTDQDLARKK